VSLEVSIYKTKQKKKRLNVIIYLRIWARKSWDSSKDERELMA